MRDRSNPCPQRSGHRITPSKRVSDVRAGDETSHEVTYVWDTPSIACDHHDRDSVCIRVRSVLTGRSC